MPSPSIKLAITSFFRTSLVTRSAFSLIEISIVLTIFGIILSSSLMFFQSQNNNSLLEANEKRMHAIERALNVYFAKNLNLPCPADPTIDESDLEFGSEYLDNSETGCAIQLMNRTATRHNKVKLVGNLMWPVGFATHMPNVSDLVNRVHFIFGGIPTKVLGLPNEYAFDEYGNKITYVVHEPIANFRRHFASIFRNMIGYAMVQTFGERTDDPGKAGVTIVQDNAICRKNGVMLFSKYLTGSSSNGVGLVFPPCNAQIITSGSRAIHGAQNNLAYVIISHGRDGSGAFSRDSKKGLCNSTVPGSMQSKNSYCEYFRGDGSIDQDKYSTELAKLHPLTFYHGPPVTTDDERIKFDDTVLWATYDDMIFKNNLSSILLCHPTTFYRLPGGIRLNRRNEIECITAQANCSSLVPKLRALRIEYARPIPSNDSLSMRTDKNIVPSGEFTQRCYPGGIWQE